MRRAQIINVTALDHEIDDRETIQGKLLSDVDQVATPFRVGWWLVARQFGAPVSDMHNLIVVEALILLVGRRNGTNSRPSTGSPPLRLSDQHGRCSGVKTSERKERKR
jgi:hypothetical protein